LGDKDDKKRGSDGRAWTKEAEGGVRPAFLEESRPEKLPPPDGSLAPDESGDDLDPSLDALASGVMEAAGGPSPESAAVVAAFHQNLKRARPRIPNLAAGKAAPPLPKRRKGGGRPDPRDSLIAAARGEPTLALKLLQSLQEGPSRMARRSLDLDEIGRRLPLPMLRDLVAGAVGGGGAGPESPWDPLLANVWRHTLISARTAEIVARDQLRREPGAIYTIALLHNVGEVAIIDLFHGLGREAPADGIARGQLATELARFHETIGAVILRRWQLPSILAAVAEKHHDPLAHPPGTPPARYAALVAGASSAATLVGVRYREGGAAEGVLATCADILGVDPDVMTAAAKTALAEWSHEEPAGAAKT